MNNKLRGVAAAALAAVALGMAAPTAAHASSEGRRNTAIVLGGAAIYAYTRYRDARRDEDRDRWRRNDRYYGRDYYDDYRYGGGRYSDRYDRRGGYYDRDPYYRDDRYGRGYDYGYRRR